MRKISLSLLLLLLVFSTINAFANVNTDNVMLSYEKYNEFRNEGYIGEEVTYDDLLKLYNQSKQLEKVLENDGRFTSIELTAETYMYSGDIIITNSTIFNGIAGHAAIAISPSRILHIEGPGHLVSVISRSDFEEKYINDRWIKIYRMNDKSIAGDAASWAQTNYQNSNAKYVINKDLTTTDKTYCSKIVFQAYYYGVGSNTVHSSFSNVLKSTIMPPYSLQDVLSGGDYTCDYISNF